MMGESRRWVVTGGSQGIGDAIARRALSEGDCVAIIARNPNHSSLLSVYPESCLLIPADVTDPESVQKACAAVQKHWGGIDVLVNNAGIHRGGRIGRIAGNDWQGVLDTNLSGAFNTIRAALIFMKDGGSIVNIGAVVGLRGFKGDVAYASAKAGLIGLTHALAIELADRSITVNIVLPGLTETDMVGALSESAKATLMARIPLGRTAQASEIADVVWNVAGSTYMTGSIIAVDGGLMAALGSAQ
jgi:NAD(P)-dependent dehydrogenase (short-subunit alcohol dehydrogenase family)